MVKLQRNKLRRHQSGDSSGVATDRNLPDLERENILISVTVNSIQSVCDCLCLCAYVEIYSDIYSDYIRLSDLQTLFPQFHIIVL